MPKRSNEFQRLIHFLEERLAPIGWIVEESVEMTDPVVGCKREIDILLSGQVGHHQMEVAVECRDHQRTEDITWMDQLIGKYQHLPVNRVVAVASSGFSANAKEAAARANIETMTVTEIEEVDWEKEVSLFSTAIIERSLIMIRDVRVVCRDEDAGEWIAPENGSIVLDHTGRTVADLAAFKVAYGERWLPRIDEVLRNQMPSIIDRQSDLDMEGKHTESGLRLRVRGEDGRERPVDRIELDFFVEVRWTVGEVRHYRYNNQPFSVGSVSASGTDVRIIATNTLKDKPEFGIVMETKAEDGTVERSQIIARPVDPKSADDNDQDDRADNDAEDDDESEEPPVQEA